MNPLIVWNTCTKTDVGMLHLEYISNNPPGSIRVTLLWLFSELWHGLDKFCSNPMTQRHCPLEDTNQDWYFITSSLSRNIKLGMALFWNTEFTIWFGLLPKHSNVQAHQMVNVFFAAIHNAPSFSQKKSSPEWYEMVPEPSACISSSMSPVLLQVSWTQLQDCPNTLQMYS